MENRELLDSEKKVLYGLVQWAGTTDQFLSKRLDMKVPTVTSIRMKLRKKGYFITRIVPQVQFFGSELLSISYVKFSSHPTLENKLRQGRRVLNKEEFVFSISEANQDFFIQFTMNYTDARRNIEEIEEAYKAISHLEGGIVSVHFPFELSEVDNYFDYGPLLRKAFGLESAFPDGPEAGRDMLKGAVGPIDLSNKERVVLYGICKYPELNDVEISERINASRMTIGKTRKKLRSKGIIRTINIPDLEKLGFELMMVTHGQFNTTLTEGLKYYIPGVMKKVGPPVFTVYGKNELLMIHVFRNFQEFKDSSNDLTQHYKEHEMFSGPPRRLMFSVPNMRTVKDHMYAPFLLKAFDLKKPDP